MSFRALCFKRKMRHRGSNFAAEKRDFNGQHMMTSVTDELWRDYRTAARWGRNSSRPNDRECVLLV